jgi:hypothetical protein
MQMTKQWLKRGLILPAIVGSVLSIPITAAQAALVTYSYSFTGNIAGDPIGLVPVHGSFQFDNSAGDSGGTYTGAVKALSLTIGSGPSSYTAVLAPGANAVTISQNTNLGGGILGDRWALVTDATGPQTPTFSPFRFDMHFDDASGGALTNTNLQGPPSLSAVSATRWRLLFEDGNGDPVALRGAITSLTAVPLPAAVLLFGAGLISLVGLGAGGLRNLRGAKA